MSENLIPEDSMAEILARLKRIEGQARGLQRMLEEGRSCDEIVIQLAAMKSAVNTVGMRIIGQHLAGCLQQSEDPEEYQEKLEKAIDMFVRLA
ncbi:MAG: metal-sensitive transcriptional regulator [Bacillota bacterium]